MAYCSYSKCTTKNVPCSKTTFFNLPKDHRREIWIINSGNRALKDIKPNANRQFCEYHFDPKFLRRQFTRTVLHRNAIPYKFSETDEMLSDESEILEFEDQTNEKEEPLRNSAESFSVVYREFEESCLDGDDECLDNKYSIVKSEEGENTIKSINEGEILEERKNESTGEEYENVVQYVNEYDFVVQTSEKTTQKVPIPPNTDVPPTKLTRMSELRHSCTADFDEAYDEDKHFALSLIGYFKRLPRKTKAAAKLKILQYLTELECECASVTLK